MLSTKKVKTEPSSQQLYLNPFIEQLLEFQKELELLRQLHQTQTPDSLSQEIIAWQQQQITLFVRQLKSIKPIGSPQEKVKDCARQLLKNINAFYKAEQPTPDTRSFFEKLCNFLLSCSGGYRSETTKQKNSQKLARDRFFEKERDYCNTIVAKESDVSTAETPSPLQLMP